MNRTPMAVGKGLAAKREADRRAWQARQAQARQNQKRANAQAMKKVARGA